MHAQRCPPLPLMCFASGHTGIPLQNVGGGWVFVSSLIPPEMEKRGGLGEERSGGWGGADLKSFQSSSSPNQSQLESFIFLWASGVR